MARSLLERLVLGAQVVGGLTNTRVNEQLLEQLDAGGSELDPTKISIDKLDPLITGTTLDVKVILDACFGNPVTKIIPHFAAATGGNEIDVTLADATEGGTRGAGARQYRIEKGVLVPLRVYASGGRAACDFAIYPVLGTNKPIRRLATTAAASAPAALWRLCGIREGVTILYGIMDWSIDFGIAVRTLQPACSQYSTIAGLFGYAPTAQFSTHDIGVALGQVTSAGAIIGNAVGASPLEFVLAPYDANGLVDASANAGIALQFRQGGLWFPQSIDLPTMGPAVMQMGVVGIGAASGLAVTDVPLTFDRTSTPDAEAAATQYMTGPALDNATPLEVESGRVTFGLSVLPTTPAHQPWPTSVFIARRETRFAFTLMDAVAYASLWTAVTDVPARAIATAFHATLRKVTAQGVAVADATAEHTKISLTAGTILGRAINAEHAQITRPEIEVVGKVAAAINVASAI